MASRITGQPVLYFLGLNQLPSLLEVRLRLEDGVQRQVKFYRRVIAESIAVARRRLGVDGAVTLLDDVLPVIEVPEVDRATHATAQARYRSSLPSGVSFVDQVSLAMLEREGIDVAVLIPTSFVRG